MFERSFWDDLSEVGYNSRVFRYNPIDFGKTAIIKPVILLVDDEAVVRRFVQLALMMHGFEVLAACNGYEALETSRRYDGHIDLLLSDVSMPDMTGPQLIQAIAPERPGIKILLMTGHSSVEIPAHLRPDVLRKPFPPGVLIDRVGQALAHAAHA